MSLRNVRGSRNYIMLRDLKFTHNRKSRVDPECNCVFSQIVETLLRYVFTEKLSLL